jgi:hypothetical protein
MISCPCAFDPLFSKLLSVNQGISFSLIPIYCLSICWQSLAQIPKTIGITEPAKITDSMRVLIDRGAGKPKMKEPAKIDRELRKHKDALSVSGSGFARLKFFSPGEYMNTYVDAAALNGTTIYSFPCNLGHKNGSKAIVNWEVKGTTKRACESGMRVTASDRGNSRISHHSFQPFEVAALKDISRSKQQASDTVRSNKELSIALTSDNIRYYCSALPNAGQRGRGIGFGEISIKESCDNAIKECGSGCSLTTMGEWSVNDPELLMMSLTCGDRKPLWKRVSGSDVNINIILVDTLLRDVVAEVLGLKPETCFLDVYHPDEIIISPVDNQKTVVESSDVEKGRVQVRVLAGQAMLRSTNQPEGKTANQGDTYTFNGQGEISPSRTRRSQIPSPTPSTSSTPSPTPSTYSIPSLSPSTSSTPSPPIIK